MVTPSLSLSHRAKILSLLFMNIGFLYAETDVSQKIWNAKDHRFKVEVLVENRDVIWGFDFLPDQRVILTERNGKISVVDLTSKKIETLAGAPVVYNEGQGGLLDIRVHPDFKNKPWVYYAYSEQTAKGATTALGRATWDGKKLTGAKKIFSAKAVNQKEIHFGGRIEFDLQGHVYLSVGERGDRDLAQRLDVANGKILRLKEDGSVPKDNPEVWSYGHRNPQGLARHPETGDLWEGEFGPRGGDEINIIKPGLNYGWPVITYGREYHGPKIGETHKSGMEQPIVYYVPSISPSGMNFYTGNKFPKWRNDLFVGTLSGQHLRRLVIKKHNVIWQEELLKDLHWRIRNVREGADGYLYVSTDEGVLARLVPVN